MARQEIKIVGKKISSKQWSNLILELNLIRKQWAPYATIDIQGPGVKRIVKYGTTVAKYK
tara:strand:- start:322 stop:501 length:180 start_codon:yes stop_codon:yes gene_type:complete